VCFSSSVYGAFKSLQMCRGLWLTRPPQTPWASSQHRLTVKINSTGVRVMGVLAGESELLTLVLATLPLYFNMTDRVCGQPNQLSLVAFPGKY